MNYLNLVDHGTNFQLLVRIGDGFTKSSTAVKEAYGNGWVKDFGPPEVLLCDEGLEFEGEFAAAVEHQGTF